MGFGFTLARRLASASALLTGSVLAAGCGSDAADPDADPAAPDIADDGAADDVADVGADADADDGADAVPDAVPDATGDTTPDAAPDAAGDTAPADAALDAPLDATPSQASPGCGLAPRDTLGGAQVGRPFSAAAGGDRSYYIVVPTDYDPDATHRLVFGFAGTNWTGSMIRPYFGIEAPGAREIYVYPDVLWRDFVGWGNLGGWLLGPWAAPADGQDDIEFVRELLDRLEAEYCIDVAQVFATGHSWGGDVTAVVGCFLGDRFTGVAPIAANRPYWFEPGRGAPVGCVGDAAVWTFFGQNDTHFTAQPYTGAYGFEQDGFWAALRGCGDGEVDLGIGAAGECVAHVGCVSDVRRCIYESSAGHQKPSYFATVFRAWMDSF